MQRIPIIGGQGKAATEADLRSALATWAVSFSSLVTSTCDRIRNESKQRETRRHTLLWQLRMSPLARQAAFRPDAQEAYVASLALSSAQQHYFASGDGRGLFGEQQPIAVATATKLEQDVIDLGREFLSERQLTQLQEQVDVLVTQHPISGVFGVDSLVQGFADPTVRTSFGWIFDLPMVPFRALSGVSDTAQAVHDFNETAREFTDTVNDLPQLTRFELELLLYDAEDLDTTERALAAAESFSTSADRISAVAETLPEDFGTQLSGRLEEARATITELDATLARAESLAGPLTHVADRVGEASAQWTTLLTEMRASGGKSDGRPFDIREYEATATRIEDATREIRSLITELNGLDPDAAEAIIDRATWRAALLIGVFFVALLAYRLVASKLR
jgi:hypothetical protein